MGISTSSDFGRVETSKLTTVINITIIISPSTTENLSIIRRHLVFSAAIFSIIILSTHHRESTSTLILHIIHRLSFIIVRHHSPLPLPEGWWVDLPASLPSPSHDCRDIWRRKGHISFPCSSFCNVGSKIISISRKCFVCIHTNTTSSIIVIYSYRSWTRCSFDTYYWFAFLRCISVT